MKTVSEYEMLKLLRENDNRKAHKKDFTEAYVMFDNEGVLRWYGLYQSNNNPYKIVLNPYHEWIIEEPQKQLKKMSFAEAYYTFHLNDKYVCGDLKSALTGKGFQGTINHTKEEYMGLWTVSEVYEE